MSDEQLSKCLAELGNITRLKIFKLLVKAGKDGLSVGIIQKSIYIPNSTLSHHLTKLSYQDLILQKKEGRVIKCIANYDILDLVIKTLYKSCCVDFSE